MALNLGDDAVVEADISSWRAGTTIRSRHFAFASQIGVPVRMPNAFAS